MFPGYSGGGYYGGGGGSYSSIPLDIKIPQFPSAAQYAGEAVNLQDAITRRQLTQAEIQNQQLLAQGRQKELDAANGIGQLISQNTSTPVPPAPPAAASSNSMAPAMNGDFGGESGPAAPVPDVQTAMPDQRQAYTAAAGQNVIGNIHGYPVTNWDAVRRQADANGWGKQFMAYDTERRNNDSAALTQEKNRLAVVADKLNMTAQAMTPLQMLDPKTSSPDQYQDAWRTARNTLLQNGVATEDQIPVNYNPDLAKQWFQMGPNAQKTLAEHMQFLDANNKLVQGQVATTADKAKVANTVLASAQSPDDVAHGILNAKGNGGFSDQDLVQLFHAVPDPQTGAPMMAQNGMPIVNWSPQVKAQAQQALVPPQDLARSQQANLQMIGPKLATAFDQGPDKYAAALSQVEQQYPDFKGVFPPNPTDRDAIMQASMPATAAETQQTRQQNADTRASMADTRASLAELQSKLLQMKIDAGGDSHKTLIAGLVNQAFNDSLNGGGKSIDDAIGNVSNASYYKGAPIGQYRAEVLQGLEALRGTTARAANAENKGGGSDILGKFAALAGKGKPTPASTPAATPAVTPAAPPPATRAAATAPPHINTQAAYDALPSGTVYIEPDGKTYRKP